MIIKGQVNACPFLKIKFNIMKKIILSVALLAVGFSFAQKKEIAAAFKAIEANDNAAATTQISTVDAVLAGKTFLLEPAVLEQYYYAKGLSLINSGKVSEGAAVLSKISALGKSKIYSGKNAEKQKVYYVGKTEADASGIQGLKEETYTPTTLGTIGNKINPLLNKTNEEAMAAYNAKNNEVAASKFLEIHNLLSAVGSEDKTYKYYAAVTYYQAQKTDIAAQLYSELINEGYTGVKTEYKAKNKKDGKVESLDKATWELYKKMGTSSEYTDFTTESSASVEQELYESAAGLLTDTQKYDEALAIVKKGIEKFPKSTKLTEMEGTIYYKSGRMEQFMQNLKDQVAKNPNDKVNWYNLGVLASKDPAKLTEAEGYFKKSLEIDPNYVVGLQGVIYNVYVAGDDKAIETIEAARKAKKTELFNKLLEERRAKFGKAIPYAEKWYSLEPKNLEIVSLLKGLYLTTHNDAKFQELKAVETALKAAAK